jgi:hypothetical protein
MVHSNSLEPSEIPSKHATFTIDYPLSNPASFEINRPKNITFFDIVDEICNAYAKIYQEEEETMNEDISDQNTPVFNRKQSNGKHGIWGHYIEQLVIERLEYDMSKEKISMSIGS